MPFIHGVTTQVLVDDTALTAYINSAEWSGDGEVSETTTFGVAGNAKTFIRGLNGGAFTIGGFYDSTSPAGPDVELAAQRTSTTAAAVSYGPEGFALGKLVKLLGARETSYKVSSPIGDATAIAADFTADGPLDQGVSLYDLTSTSATINGTGYDGTASSANGGVGHIHVPVNTRNGAIVCKVQHSTDNVTFADLITFASITASTTTAERLAVTGTVNRYVRAQVFSVGGTTGAATIQMSFARR